MKKVWHNSNPGESWLAYGVWIKNFLLSPKHKSPPFYQGLSIKRVKNLYLVCSKTVISQCVLTIPSIIAGSWFTSDW